MTDERWATCIHEASHGVAHVLHGAAVGKIVIYDPPVDGRAGKVFVPPNNWMTPEQRALCYLVGPAGEYRFCGGKHYAKAGRGDVRMAQDSLSGTNLRVKDIWPRAIRFVDWTAVSIERVAQRLLQQGELSGGELSTLLRSRGWRSPRW